VLGTTDGATADKLITEVVAGGPSAGLLAVGDAVVALNGKKVAKRTHREVLELIKEAGKLEMRARCSFSMNPATTLNSAIVESARCSVSMTMNPATTLNAAITPLKDGTTLIAIQQDFAAPLLLDPTIAGVEASTRVTNGDPLGCPCILLFPP
jgi:hypothetical protein